MKKALKALLISVLVIVITVFAALWFYVYFIEWRIGTEKVIGHQWYGWVDEVDARKFNEFSRLRSDTADYAAANKMRDIGLKTGLCKEFAEGEIVYVTDKRLGSGLVKVRPRGELREYWIGVFWVRSKTLAHAPSNE